MLDRKMDDREAITVTNRGMFGPLKEAISNK
jgi:hypothetical protein